jgi:hypothetical protein
VSSMGFTGATISGTQAESVVSAIELTPMS